MRILTTATCPACRLLNPGTAVRCDCGYDFASGTVQKPHLREGGNSRQGSLHAHGSRVEGRPMIAVDTSAWIAFLQGDGGEDAELLDRALEDRQVLMVPVVLTEVLSDPRLSSEVAQTLSELPLIEVGPGYWQRAGELRAKVLAKRRKARLGDALIAQSCMDRGIPLLTRDRDFRAFADAAGLDLVIGSAPG